jgi:hypothetical protein
MILFDCKDLIESSMKYFKKYNIKNKVWSKYMEDESIPIEIRNLINGVRYIYANEINNKLENCCLFDKNEIYVYPTGSKNLSSDIDTQIAVNINKNIDIEKINKITEKIITLLNNSKKLWKIKSIEKSLDINYYPPSLLNISNKKLNVHYILCSKNKNKIKMYDTIWVPQLNNKKLYEEFYNKELNLLKNYKKKYKLHNTYNYYSKYDKENINCLYNLINNKSIYKINNYEDDKKINDNIHCLVKHFHIGPEMYFTYSSVLLIVWFDQLKHKIPINIIKKLSAIALKEHQLLYEITKKQKYLDRVNFLMDIKYIKY